MRIALISDIHGNLVSLDAVLADINRKEIDQIVCLGDVADLGPQPCQVLAQLKSLGCRCVMGNHDADLINLASGKKALEAPPLVFESLQWCANQLTMDDFEYLRSFQPFVKMSLDVSATLLCFHGSPRSNTDYILARTPIPELEEMLSGYSATVLAGGHTHLQMLRRYEERTIVNAGSVGGPLEQLPFRDGPRFMPWSEYAIVSWIADNLSIELNRISIDVKQVKEAALDSEMPNANIWVQQWEI
jgi:predicted phosphodiesterase